MGVCDFLTLDRCFISCYSIFLDRIDNFLTCFVFWKISKGMFPNIAIRWVCFSDFDIIFLNFGSHTTNCLHQVNRDMVWTFAILVIIVIPSFRHLIINHFWCVFVGNIEIIDFASIFRNDFFGQAIFNHLACFEFRKFCKDCRPSAVSCRFHFFGSYFFTVSQEVDRNRFRTFAILVIGIIPVLCGFNVNRFWSIFVRDCKASCCISADFTCITSY